MSRERTVIMASGEARTLALQMGVTLNDVRPEVPGHVTEKDVRAHAQRTAPRRAFASVDARPGSSPPPTPADRKRTTDANAAVRASANVRQLADRLGVGLSEVPATGAGGRITMNDVRALARPAAVGTSGALPAFTASGVDPQALLRYPSPVRPAMAAAATHGAAFAMANKYQGMSDADAKDALAFDVTVPVHLGGAYLAWPTDD